MNAKPVTLRCYWADWQLVFSSPNARHCVWEQNLYAHARTKPVRIGTLQKIKVYTDSTHPLGPGVHWGFSFAGETQTRYFGSRPAAVRRLRN